MLSTLSSRSFALLAIGVALSFGACRKDDKDAGIRVNTDSDDPLQTSESGGQATFTVVLQVQPAANVTIAILSGDTSEVVVSPAELVFTPSNWNAPQEVIATGVDDDVADGDQLVTITIGPADSDDEDYDGLMGPSVIITNLDNDSPGVLINAPALLSVTEAGTQASFTAVLRSRPSADVVFDLSSSNTAEVMVSPTTLTFTPVNWAAPQAVTVTGVPDERADGNQRVTIVTSTTRSDDTNYDGLHVSNVEVENIDLDSAGIQLIYSNEGLVTHENGTSDSFKIVLNTQPTANVSFGLSIDDPTEAMVAPSSVTFTPDNWNAPQTVTVHGVADLVADGDQPFRVLIGNGVSTDSNYDGIQVPYVPGINLDNDSPAIRVLITEAPLLTTEAGGQATFTIVLNMEPTANVVLPLTSSDTTEGVVAPASLAFTPANWNAPQFVTVTGINDDVADGNQVYHIHIGPAVSSDPAYGGRVVAAVQVTNIDNNSPGITLADHVGLTTTEAGGQDTFTIVLNSQPIADVTLALSSSDTTEATVAPASITFTPLNWDVPQQVTVTGVDDLLADGDQPFTITIGPAVSDDPGYGGRTIPNVMGINLDDESNRFTVSAVPYLTTSEGGAQASFTVVLNTEPVADVNIPVSSSDPGEGVPNTALLVFNTSNWSVPQTVTVTGMDDAIHDGNQPYRIDLGPAQSADPYYDEETLASVHLINLDDESAGITVSPGVLVTQESGSQDAFTIVLHTEPAKDVTISISSSDTSEAVVSPNMITFTAANWSTPQTITVTGVNDFVADGPQPFQILFSVSSSDPVYAGRVLPNKVGTNLDNDSPGFVLSKLSVTTFELGGSDTFTVALTSQPTAHVSIGVSSLNLAEGTVSPSVLVFTHANWNTPQTATVTGKDDGVLDGNQNYTVQLAAAVSADPMYDGLNPPNVNATNIEAAPSCAELNARMPGLADGLYQLDTDQTGPNPQFEAYCDMTTDGGGWTLLSWSGNSNSNPAGVPYPGLAYCADYSCARGSSVPAGSLNALFANSEELGQGQSTTINFKATFGNLGSYEYAGRFVYPSLAALEVEYNYSSCEGIAEGVYVDLVNTAEHHEVTVYLNRAFYIGGSASQSDFSSDGHGYVWSIGNRSGYCQINNAQPASYLGTWSAGQFGPAVISAVGSYSVWVR